MKKKKVMLVMLIILVMVVSVMFYFSQGLRRTYEQEVKKGLETISVAKSELLTNEDIILLPESVQKYLNYVGVVGKPKISNFRASMAGKMKQDVKKDWMNVDAVQYNFFESPVRMFYINGRMFGIPVYGLHAYKDEKGTMLIKAAGLIPVVDQKGKEMDLSDTVTIFNDMCLFAPASLIDNRITWEIIDALTAKATFTNGTNKISAILYFNEKGELINFVSNDRYMGYVNTRWSTPIWSYEKFGDYTLPAKASAIWTLPEGDFTYAEFDMKEIEYNCTELK